MDDLGPFLLASLAICVAPGADMAFIAASGLAGGRRAGIVSACGVSAGVTVWVLVTAFGLGAVLEAAPTLQLSLRVVGAAYLGVLAWQTWHSAAQAESLGGLTTRRVFLRGFTTNVLNPKMLLFFTAFLPQFATTDGWSVTVQLVVLGLTLQTIGLIVDGAVGYAAGSSRTMARPGTPSGTRLTRLASAVLAALTVAVGVEAVVGV